MGTDRWKKLGKSRPEGFHTESEPKKRAKGDRLPELDFSELGLPQQPVVVTLSDYDIYPRWWTSYMPITIVPLAEKHGELFTVLLHGCSDDPVPELCLVDVSADNGDWNDIVYLEFKFHPEIKLSTRVRRLLHETSRRTHGAYVGSVPCGLTRGGASRSGISRGGDRREWYVAII